MKFLDDLAIQSTARQLNMPVEEVRETAKLMEEWSASWDASTSGTFLKWFRRQWLILGIVTGFPLGVVAGFLYGSLK